MASAVTPTRPLRGLFQAQFLGAFEDNAFKLMVALLAVRALGEAPSAAEVQGQLSLGLVVFALPLVLFSVPAALLADRFCKRRSLVVLKGGEFAIMLAATAVLLFAPSNLALVLGCLAAMAVQSAFFSPVKAAILPELVPHEKLSAANGFLQMVTFVAIVVGTWAGGAMLQTTGDSPWIGAAALSVLSVVGWQAIRRIPAPPARPRSTARARAVLGDAARALVGDRRLLFVTLGLALLWATLSLLSQNMLAYGRDAADGLGLAERWVGLPLALCGLGAGLGCGLAGRLSARKVELGLVPFGALALAASLVAMAGWMPGFAGTVAVVSLAGFASGFVIVPLEATLQWRAPEKQRGAVLALSNSAIFAGIFVGSLATGWLARSGLDYRQIFAVGAGVSMLGTLAVVCLLPEILLRAVALVVTRTVYRLRVLHAARVPEKGPALLVANHVSFVDGVMILAATDRPVRFLVQESYFRRPVIGRVLRMLRAIPVASGSGPREILRALRSAGAALDEGEVVCIFAEGQITRVGGALPFRRGLEQILRGREAPIVPVYLDRLWGSVFSRSAGRFFFKWPRSIPFRVTVAFGEPLPAETSSVQVRRALLELGPEAWAERARENLTPARRFVSAVRRAPRRPMFHDLEGESLSRSRALAGSLALGRALRARLGEVEPGEGANLGVMLPASKAAALVQVAAALGGRTVVPLNFTAGSSAIASAARQASLRVVITSRRFLEKAKLAVPPDVEALYVEDLAASIGRGRKVQAMLLALFAPKRWLERYCGARGRPAAHAPMAILFSSGSSGEPKGVVLSHFNVDCDVQAIDQMLPLGERGGLLGVLPPFHAFGLLSLWYGASRGMPIAFHPDPLDARAVGRLVEEHGLTLMLSTPTFLSSWSRRCAPGSFGSLQMVITGAEKLRPAVAEAFEQRFGIRPLEGYGATECAPVVACNTFDYRAPGFFQRGSKDGTVGHPLPGVAVRVVDEAGALLGADEEGEILVKGCNVMQRYLGREDLTAERVVDGWYRTGDVGKVDAEGFLTLTDRLTRFSKIGGEMVPHGTVEMALQEASGREERAFAVTSFPDARKGEALGVVSTVDGADVPVLLDKLRRGDLPNLYVPREDAFVFVDELPLLGSGKLDLGRVKELVRECCAS